jgi:hypothetical protein
MSTPNTGPDHLDPVDSDDPESLRRRNPAFVYQEEPTGAVEAASTRATTVSNRFGSARHALTGRKSPEAPEPPDAPESPDAA